jgi:hypothetical protein
MNIRQSVSSEMVGWLLHRSPTGQAALKASYRRSHWLSVEHWISNVLFDENQINQSNQINQINQSHDIRHGGAHHIVNHTPVL